MSNKENGIPNWLAFLFFGALAVGVVYGVYRHGFAAAPADIVISEPSGLVVARVTKVARSDAAIAAGEQLAASCAACHGQGLVGAAIGPNLMDAEWLHDAQSEKALYRLIVNGISSGMKFGNKAAVMPPMGSLTSEADVWRVVYYLSSKNRSIKKDAD